MAFLDHAAFPRAHQAAAGEDPDCLQQPVTALRLVHISVDQGLIHEVRQHIQHRVVVQDFVGAHTLGCVAGETSGEH